MRRLVAGLVAAASAVALALVPASAASAVAPVDPLPWVPSSLNYGTSTTVGPSGLILADKPPGMTEADWQALRERERNYRQTLIDDARTRGLTPSTAPQPVSPAKPPARGAGGAGLLGNIMLAPVVVDGLLQMVVISKEGQALGVDDVDDLICTAGIPTDDNWFTGWLYGGVDCAGKVVQPNPGVVGGTTVPGYVGSYVVVIPTVGNSNYICAASAVTLSSPLVYQQSNNINSNWTTGSFQAGSSSIASCGTGKFWFSPVPKSDGYLPVSLRVYNTSTNTVVAVGTANDTDPQRQARCRVGWGDGTITTGEGITYREGADGFPIISSAMGCEEAYSQRPSPGTLPEWVKVESEDDQGAITEIATMPVPAEVEQPKPSEGLKLLRVLGTELRSCMTWEADCADWWTQSTQGTDTSKYRCTFGGEEIALAECGVYRNTFKNPDDVKVRDPLEDYEYNWGTGDDPYTPPAGDVVTGGGACSPSWSWNPVDWVLNPLKCAFIPSTAAVSAAQSRIQDGIDQSVVGSVGASLAVLGSAFDAGVGCGGLPFHLEAFGHTLVDAQLLASCDEPAAGIAATVRTILSVAIIGGGIMAFTRYLGSLFGFSAFGRNRTDSGKGGPSFD